jgi:formylglycine-generating enzyme required for sulfatase activity
MTLVLVPPGVFLMGSPREEMWREANEEQHEVEITRGFYLGMYQVTQKQYRTVMGKNPSWFSPSGSRRHVVKGLATANFPVENVDWKDVQTFLKTLSALASEKQARRRYRLPTEAEWEYACRGGAADSKPFHYGDSLSLLANFNGMFPFGNSESGPYLERPCPVGSYQPNGFGLYDMHGNVEEWCADWVRWDYYATSPPRDPTGPSRGEVRVIRGGSWIDGSSRCRSASRGSRRPGAGGASTLGFRVALDRPNR